MTVSEHARRMASTYSTGTIARVVAAGGRPGFMNLGFAIDAVHPGSTAARQRRLAYMVRDAVAAQHGQRVLDLGCGKGGMVDLLTSGWPTPFVIGANVDGIQLLTAASRVRRGRWAVADAVRLPFRDRSFDRVVAVELLSHVPDKDRLAEEIHRVIAPGGRAVIAFIALNRPFAEFDPSAREHLSRLADFFAESPWDVPTYEAVVGAFSDAGLALEETVDLTDGVFAPRHQTFLRLLRILGGNVLVRSVGSLAIRLRWRVDRAEFMRFLRANVSSHPCRFYEYHLITLRRPG